MSIAVQVALVMVVLLVLLLAAGVPIGVGIGLSSAVSMICMLPSNVAFATSAQRIFAGFQLIFTDCDSVFHSCRKHYE